jgi:hypothetical protein
MSLLSFTSPDWGRPWGADAVEQHDGNRRAPTFRGLWRVDRHSRSWSSGIV